MVKRIVLLRHGKPESEGIADDALWPLSEEGKVVQRKLTLKLKEKGIVPTHIYTSPLLRAIQTADIASDIMGVPVIEEPALGNDFDGHKLLDRIRQAPEEATIFFVGHAPTLADFSNHSVGKDVLPEGLAKSSAAILEFEGIPAFGNATFIDYFK